MSNREWTHAFSNLSTPLVADACLRLSIPLRVAPKGMHPIIPGRRFARRAIPVRHYGSVDIFLEAFETAEPADVLVIDNRGRDDEACIGDLTILEARASGLTGIVLWGCHRDTAELIEIGFPVFSHGTCPAGPIRLDQRESNALTMARFGHCEVTRDDVAFADDDGVLYVAEKLTQEVLSIAGSIWQTERRQADEVKAGKTLRQQLRFNEYLAKRDSDPTHTFRKHLRALGGAIEE